MLLFQICTTPSKYLTASNHVNASTPEVNISSDSLMMTPNTRQRKSRLAKDLAGYVENWQLNKDDKLEVVTLSLKQLGLLDQIRFQRKPTTAGRMLTPFTTRMMVWKFWHEKSIPSTITSRPAKQRVSEKSKIQAGLDYVDTISIIRQRNRHFYESNWYITNETFKALYSKYIQDNTANCVSYGTFLSLKPFYVRSANTEDMEMCCCKKHLHARWSIQVLIECCDKQGINLGSISDYYTFFDYLTENCGSEEITNIPWECVSDKNKLCEHIKGRWGTLMQDVLKEEDDTITVKMQHFKMVETVAKNGKVSKRLTAITTNANLTFIVNFISEILSKIIHHRNHLKHYRTSIKLFKESIDAICYLDVDFSENLTIPVKFEPQSLHWSHEQVTIHSAILKSLTGKSYHPYVIESMTNILLFIVLRKCYKK